MKYPIKNRDILIMSLEIFYVELFKPVSCFIKEEKTCEKTKEYIVLINIHHINN